MRHIVQIHLDGGVLHEHITWVRWRDGITAGEASREEMVQWIRAGGDARVAAASGVVKVEVVNARPPYLRTKANGVLTDNLLELPRF
ncbi:DUF3892 domain-containing protein [Myxococcus sp. K15C18031901]|uniref:DUF3892 domain-containing protein n=1 Tax=Myxococcus dinghuensis TaxID=2906761 RepID=UPI0020A7E925|nr:DUF3892 domain-containing protein [Myxococcus dinghuensis]MCP3097305.1 DUF3892 domain-containing protein [Myxococcus dinghuensis]